MTTLPDAWEARREAAKWADPVGWVELGYLNGCTVDELAEDMGWSRWKVRRTITAIRRRWAAAPAPQWAQEPRPPLRLVKGGRTR